MGRIGDKVSGKYASVKKGLRTDPNLTRARHGIVRGGKALPGATGRYLVQKVPFTQWIPRYSPIWIINDAIAGVTIAMLLIPQALSFAALAGLPLQMGLIASWVPSVLYFFMGTSKDLSTGPTSIVALLTGQVIAIFSRGPPGFGPPAGVFPPSGTVMSGVPAPPGVFPTRDMMSTGTKSGFMAASTGGVMAAAVGPPPGALPAGSPPLPPALIAASVAIGVGGISLVFGLLKLGWVLNFISIPVLTGFIMSASLIVLQSQVPILLGEVGVSNDFITQGPDIINKLGTSQPLTIAIGVLSIFLLVVLQLMGSKWGKKNKAVQRVSNARNVIVIALFTGISFGVNNDLTTPLWEVTGSVPVGLQAPRTPPLMLLSIISLLGIPVFIAGSLEHLAVGEHFGRVNNYEIDPSQELVFLGVANIVNGILGGMPVSGGDISRTSVNSESQVKSPLSHIFTSGLVLLGIFFLNGAVFWIPKATIAAVIVVAVFNAMPPIALLGVYWKTSFADSIAAFFAFQLTLVASAENGIGIGVAIMIIYTIIRMTFAHGRPLSRTDLVNQYGADPSSPEKNTIPSGTQVMTFNSSILFLNASRIRRDIVDTVKAYHNGIPAFKRPGERVWNDLGDKHIAYLRRRAKLDVPIKLIPRIQILVLDFTQVTFIDTTGMQMLRDVKAEIHAYGGEDVEMRFVGLNGFMKNRFSRAKWGLASQSEAERGFAEDRDVCYELLRPAIEAGRLIRDSGLDFGFGNVLMSDGGSGDSRYSYGGDEEKGRVIVTQVGVKGGKAYKEY